MKALLLAPSTADGMDECGGRDLEREWNSAIWPVMNKAAVWHLVTLMKDWGVERILCAPWYAADPGVRTTLGGGERWSMEILYPADPRELIRLMEGGGDDTLIVVSPTFVGLGTPEAFLAAGVPRKVVLEAAAPPLGADEPRSTGLWSLRGSLMVSILESAGGRNGMRGGGRTRLDAPTFRELVRRSGAGLESRNASLVWCPVDDVKSLLDANMAALEGLLPLLTHEAEEKSEGVWVGAGSVISDKAHLVPPVFIGENVVVCEGAVVERSVIGSGSVLSEECIVRNAVVGDDTFVGRLTELEEALVRGNVLQHAAAPHPTVVTDPFLLSDRRRGWRVNVFTLLKGLARECWACLRGITQSAVHL